MLFLLGFLFRGSIQQNASVEKQKRFTPVAQEDGFGGILDSVRGVIRLSAANLDC